MAEVARQREGKRATTAAQELAALREREPEFAAFVDEYKGFFGGRVSIIEDKVTGNTYGRRDYEREYVAQPGLRKKVKRV